MNARLRENERILKEGKANYFNSRAGMVGKSAGGKLYLTNQRILFEGHGFNAGREAAIIQIKDIVSCSTRFPNTLTILTENNDEFKFAVSGKNDWKNMIMSIPPAPMEQSSSDYVKNSHAESPKDNGMEPKKRCEKTNVFSHLFFYITAFIPS